MNAPTAPHQPLGSDVPRSAGRDADLMLAALDRLRGTGAEFGGFLANHGPMAADAMIRLGGGERVERWVDHYRHQLGPAPAQRDAVTSDNWREHLGRIDRLGDWSSFFRTAVADTGWQTVLAIWWQRLLPGAAASATHGVIRTAHAIRNLVDGDDSEHLLRDEFATGLAYWAARYQTLPGNPRLAGRSELRDAIAGLPRLDPTVVSAGPGLGGRLDSLFELDGFPAALDEWGPTGGHVAALDELIGCTARVLIARAEAPIAFCHTVTAPASIRMILPIIPVGQRHATVAACWQVSASIIAAFASSPMRCALANSEAVPSAPGDIARAAVDHGDEHVIKLTEACLRQFDITGDTSLLVAAERFRGRMERPW